MSWALVAGASEGLGAAFAHGLARRGHSVLLLARRAAELDALATQIITQHKVDAQTLALDLASADLREKAAALLEGKELALSVHNAAYSPMGDFAEMPRTQSLTALDVSCRAALEVLHLVVPRFVAQKRGGIILMSSLTAFQGSPYTSVYGATKAFHLALAEGLWAELKPHGVDVMACCAGATRTPGYLRAMPNGAPGELEPEVVAEQALSYLGRGPLLIPGAFNRFASFFMRRILPRRTAVSIMAAQTRKLKATS